MITELSKMSNSKWKVFGAGRSVDKAAVGASELVNLSRVNVERTWIQKHRRIDNVVGAKAWTLTERMVGARSTG